ncbi:hypothetical protein HK101_005563, partial [Irineochytrium annulatum]
MDRLPDAALARIFIELDAPAALSEVSSRLYDVSSDAIVRSRWLIARPALLRSWSAKACQNRPATAQSFRYNLPFPHCGPMAARQVSGPPASILDTRTTDYLLRLLVTGKNPHCLPEIPLALRQPLTRALWSHACQSLHQQVVTDILSHLLESLTPQQHDLDPQAFREALYAATAFHDASPRALSLLLTHPRQTGDLRQLGGDVLALACHVGSLAAVSKVVEDGYGWEITAEKAQEMLRIASGKGYWPIVLFVVGRAGFAEHHEGLVNTYRGLFVLMQGADKGVLEPVETILDGWRAVQAAESIATDTFRLRWTLAMEMAAERGHVQLMERLLVGRKDADGQLKVTVRMFALAIRNQEWDAAERVLVARAEDDAKSNAPEPSWETDIFTNGVTTPSVDRRAELLLRYCQIPTNRLAPQLGLDVVTTPASTWETAANRHRLSATSFLVEAGPTPLYLRSHVGEEALWAAFRAGHVEVARLIELSGARLGWMESSASDGVRTPRLPPISADTLAPLGSTLATFMPPPAAMALFSALGGTW